MKVMKTIACALDLHYSTGYGKVLTMKTIETIDYFNHNLKKARILSGINQGQLAKKIGLTQAAISQFENGERFPNRETIKKLTQILNISAKDLMGKNQEDIGKHFLIRKIRGLSPKSIYLLIEYADFLKSKHD